MTGGLTNFILVFALTCISAVIVVSSSFVALVINMTKWPKDVVMTAGKLYDRLWDSKYKKGDKKDGE